MRSFFLVLLLGTAACTGGEFSDPPATAPPPGLPVPTILSLSTDEIAVGEELLFEGEGFLDDDRGYTVVEFVGVFTDDSGSGDAVDLQILPVVVSATELSWAQFGPYRVPFGATGVRLGRFDGRVRARNVSRGTEGDALQPEPLDAILKVQPSVIVRELQPDGASCAVVASALLNLLPYRFQVEAIGFEPTRFRYVLSPGTLDPDADPEVDGMAGSSHERVIEHTATGPVDALTPAERPRFAEVPAGLQAYRASVSIQATSTDDTVYTLPVRTTVHRPLEVSFRAQIEPAQMYEPVPVSGCIPGGRNGRNVNYSESTTEVRSRTVQVGWENGWTSSYTQGHENTYTEGDTETNSLGFETTDENTFSWNWNAEVYGEGSLWIFAKAGARVGGGQEYGTRHAETASQEQSWSHSRSYADSVNESTTLAESESQNGSDAFTVSSSESQALAFSGFLLPNHFGLFYRQTTRLVRNGAVTAFDACGAPIPVGEVSLDDYTWAPELAMGPTCPPFPESSMPPAQCLVPPCDE